jgi:succinoglycan biosynthesis transport protein ExoP
VHSVTAKRLSSTGAPTTGSPEKTDLDLTVFLRVVRRRFWVVALVPVVAAGAAFAAAKAQTPTYRSTADILLVRTQAEAIYAPAGGSVVDPNRLLADQIRVVRSQQLTAMVKALLGYIPIVKATGSTTEDVITLSAVSTNAKQAAAIVNAYADSYLKYRVSSSASQNGAAQAEAHRQLDTAQAQLNTLDQAVAAQPQLQQAQFRLNQASQRAPLDTQLASAQSQLSQLQAEAAVDQGGAQLLAQATVPHIPFAPKPIRSTLLGLVIGIMLGLGLAFLLDYLDNRIRGKDDLERLSGNLPVMGLIPTQGDWRDTTTAHAISIEEPDSAAAEAYRTLRTSIQFLNLEQSLQVLQVSSPATSEGKTTTLVNLAIALAKAGQRVVVVDCDLRRPRIHQFFHLESDPGFTSVLLGEVPLSKALREMKGVEGLRVLTAGPIPPNPSELLSGRRTTEILEALRTESDFVLIDSPPVLPVSDAAVIAARVDATLMVVNDNKTHGRQLTRALELLNQVEATVIGTVLNRVAKGTIDYGYGYSYGYQPYTSKKKPTDNRSRKEKAKEPLPPASRKVKQPAPVKVDDPAETPHS